MFAKRGHCDSDGSFIPLILFNRNHHRRRGQLDLYEFCSDTTFILCALSRAETLSTAGNLSVFSRARFNSAKT